MLGTSAWILRGGITHVDKCFVSPGTLKTKSFQFSVQLQVLSLLAFTKHQGLPVQCILYAQVDRTHIQVLLPIPVEVRTFSKINIFVDTNTLYII